MISYDFIAKSELLKGFGCKNYPSHHTPGLILQQDFNPVEHFRFTCDRYLLKQNIAWTASTVILVESATLIRKG